VQAVGIKQFQRSTCPRQHPLLFLRNSTERMAVASLCFFLAIVSHVAARTMPDAIVFSRAERLYPSTRSPLLDSTCRTIKSSVSNASAVYAPGTPEYAEDIGMSPSFFAVCVYSSHSTEHWVTSSTQYAVCSVEPGNVQDVSMVVSISPAIAPPLYFEAR
jgi:hypothetical protein